MPPKKILKDQGEFFMFNHKKPDYTHPHHQLSSHLEKPKRKKKEEKELEMRKIFV